MRPSCILHLQPADCSAPPESLTSLNLFTALRAVNADEGLALPRLRYNPAGNDLTTNYQLPAIPGLGSYPLRCSALLLM